MAQREWTAASCHTGVLTLMEHLPVPIPETEKRITSDLQGRI